MRYWLDQTSGETVVALSEHVARCEECSRTPTISPEDMCATGRGLLQRYALRREYEVLHANFVSDGVEAHEAERRSRQTVTIRHIHNQLEHWGELSREEKHFLALRLLEIVAKSDEEDEESGDGDGGTRLKVA